MKLTQDQLMAAGPRMMPKFCSHCGGKTFRFEPQVRALVPYEPGADAMHGEPIVTFMCQECGQFMVFSAIVLGIVPVPPDWKPVAPGN